MLRDRARRMSQAFFRPSPQFERFLATPAATLLAVVIVVVALVGGAVQLWRQEWLDGSLTLAIGLVVGGRLGADAQRHAPHRGARI